MKRLVIFSPFSINFVLQLSPLDFLNLSLTCRFLHWRMFTFCTCYAPDTVRVEILDSRLRQKNVYPSFPKAVYYYGEGRQLPHMGAPPMSMETMYWLLHHGYRGFFVEQPSCLRRPFFFETLEVEIDVITCPFIIDFYSSALFVKMMTSRDVCPLSCLFVNMPTASKLPSSSKMRSTGHRRSITLLLTTSSRF